MPSSSSSTWVGRSRSNSCTLAFEGDPKVVLFPGNSHEREADKTRRLGEEGARPKRIRFKPLK